MGEILDFIETVSEGFPTYSCFQFYQYNRSFKRDISCFDCHFNFFVSISVLINN